MDGLAKLETRILELFQQNPQTAEKKIKAWLGPQASKEERALMRHIFARLHVDEHGNWFLRKIRS